MSVVWREIFSLHDHIFFHCDKHEYYCFLKKYTHHFLDFLQQWRIKTLRGGPGHPDPELSGVRGGAISKQLFTALRASVWSKNKVGARAPPLDLPLYRILKITANMMLSFSTTNFSVKIKCLLLIIICRWKLVKRLDCFGGNRRPNDTRKKQVMRSKMCCVTLFSCSISHNFPAQKLWDDKSVK